MGKLLFIASSVSLSLNLLFVLVVSILGLCSMYGISESCTLQWFLMFYLFTGGLPLIAPALTVFIIGLLVKNYRNNTISTTFFGASLFLITQFLLAFLSFDFHAGALDWFLLIIIATAIIYAFYVRSWFLLFVELALLVVSVFHFVMWTTNACPGQSGGFRDIIFAAFSCMAQFLQ